MNNKSLRNFYNKNIEKIPLDVLYILKTCTYVGQRRDKR